MKRMLFSSLMTVLLVTAGCGGISPPEKTHPSPGQTKPPATAPTSPDSAQQQAETVALSFVEMLSDQVGWATTAGKKAILRTEDGGTSWKDTTPQELTGKKDSGLETAFLTSDLAWLATWQTESGTVTLYRTTDGGRTWKKGLLSADYPFTGAAHLSFANDQHGWVLVQPQQSMGSSPGTLYTTTDGGEHWNRVASTSSEKQGTLPFAGRIQFRADGSGWLVGRRVPTTGGRLYATRDGGRTWQPQTLTPPADHKAGILEAMMPPFSFPPEPKSQVLPVLYRPDSARATEFATIIYRTSDGGANWGSMTPLRFTGVSSFINAQDGWVWSAVPRDTGSTAPVKGQLHRTRDGGGSWKSIEPAGVLAGILQKGHDIALLDFVAEQSGWALLRSGNGKETVLLKTEDGGETWTQIYPRR